MFCQQKNHYDHKFQPESLLFTSLLHSLDEIWIQIYLVNWRFMFFINLVYFWLKSFESKNSEISFRIKFSDKTITKMLVLHKLCVTIMAPVSWFSLIENFPEDELWFRESPGLSHIFLVHYSSCDLYHLG